MTVYVLAQLRFTDRPAYDRYQARFMDVFKRFKGRLLAAIPIERLPRTVPRRARRCLTPRSKALPANKRPAIGRRFPTALYMQPPFASRGVVGRIQ